MAFEITPEVLSTAATNCDSTADEISRQLASVRQYVVNLRAEWKGVAALNFDALMQDFDGFGTMLHNALVDIGQGLRGNYNNYVDVEDFAAKNIVTVNGDIPGIYLD